MVEGLKESKAAHPISVTAQVAAIKKFVASPEQRVRFYDLLNEEAKRVRSVLDASYPVNATPVDATTTKDRFDAYDAQTAGLRSMLYAAAQWADPYNFESIRHSIFRLVPSGQRGGIVRWLDMAKYPGAACFYAAAFGAMTGGNWRLFRYLLDGRLTYGGIEENVLEYLGAVNAVNHETASVLQPRRHTPMSDHLMAILGELSGAENIERDFERFEVLLALHYILTSKEDGRYTLRGRFVWNHSNQITQRVKADIERDGDNWPPLSAGLFGGSSENAIQLVDKLFESIKKLANHYY